MRFWIERCPVSNEPRYAVEMYGITHLYSKLEYFSEFRDQLAGTRWGAFKQLVLKPLSGWAKGQIVVRDKLRAIRFHSHQAYVVICHHKEIAQFLDTAITGFSDSSVQADKHHV